MPVDEADEPGGGGESSEPRGERIDDAGDRGSVEVVVAVDDGAKRREVATSLAKSEEDESILRSQSLVPARSGLLSDEVVLRGSKGEPGVATYARRCVCASEPRGLRCVRRVIQRVEARSSRGRQGSWLRACLESAFEFTVPFGFEKTGGRRPFERAEEGDVVPCEDVDHHSGGG